MCGIAGWVDWSRNLAEQSRVVTAMTTTLSSRGPDALEIWLSEHAAFGHSRLAVVDIEGGRQPMQRIARGGDPSVITFSGEIYNFQELRLELRAHGWRFTTRSDTEVLLTAYLQWGREFAQRLNGMYAFAIWDAETRELLLVRDRLGIKPLFYARVGRGLVFGSEPKALLAHPDMRAEVDRVGIAELTVLPRARTPGVSVYRGIHEVRPGCLVVADDGGVREQRFWELTARPHTDGFTSTTDRVHELLTDIVARQIVADVPVGTLLSGGIDSSAITAMAARELNGQLTSFSVSVPVAAPGSDSWRPSQDDPFAKLVAEKLGIEHVVTEISADDLVTGIDRGLRARDAPGWGDLDTSMYLLFKAVRERCTVALSGETADEVFGGYTWQLDSDYISHPSFPWMYGRRQPDILLRDDVRREIDADTYEADRYHEALTEVPVLPGESPERRRQREVFHLGLTRWLNGLLDRKDRMSMAVGLEVRVPFADHRLAEYLFNVPTELKTRSGVAKALLRRASADLLPNEVVNRPKSAYPASRGSDHLRRIRGQVRDLLSEANAPVFDLLDRERVRTMVAGDLNSLPGPITAATPAIGLTYLLEMNRWLELYRVRIVA
ncbi:asparagine synthase (glutamine-hydrolyzing) [Micromonospora sp. NPDC049559]|uniref:asparagine synthase (glutamine-hydrolyzing) n=1 Tax=Micromonospora sp. NPDC049559 TaxID=3155923 RepID=UPI00344566E1